MIVIDTQSLLWLHFFPKRLGEKATLAIERAQTIHVPSVSLLEIAMVAKSGRIAFGVPVREWLEGMLARSRFRVSEITPDIAARAVDLDLHRDPADRIIVATAAALGLPLVTSDRKIIASRLVATVW